MNSPRPAPVALFVHARPTHFKRTLEALQQNELASKTELFVFSDGPNIDAHVQGVTEVRNMIREIEGFKQIHVVERDRNMGLARSIIEGVTSVLETHERVIALEDDLVVSAHFLKYMNDGLEMYADDDMVASIHGYVYPVGMDLPETFFLRGADCWGWATWRRAWANFDPNGSLLLERLQKNGLTRNFDMGGAYPYTQMLKDQIQGKNNSWAVRWHASCFLAGLLTLYPGRSLVQNIGNDDSGTHSGLNTDLEVELSKTPVRIERLNLKPSNVGTTAVRQYFLRTRWLPRRVIRHISARLNKLVAKI